MPKHQYITRYNLPNFFFPVYWKFIKFSFSKFIKVVIKRLNLLFLNSNWLSFNMILRYSVSSWLLSVLEEVTGSFMTQLLSTSPGWSSLFTMPTTKMCLHISLTHNTFLGSTYLLVIVLFACTICIFFSFLQVLVHMLVSQKSCSDCLHFWRLGIYSLWPFTCPFQFWQAKDIIDVFHSVIVDSFLGFFFFVCPIR